VKSSHGELVTKVKKLDSELVTCDEFIGTQTLNGYRLTRHTVNSSHMTSWLKKLLACVTSWPVPMEHILYLLWLL